MLDRRKFICSALKYIDENFGSRLVLDEPAKASGYSVPRFSKLFAEFSGITPMRYVNIVRIQHSADMLRDDKKSITEIAFECGFGSLEVFERSFKKYFGVTAAEYRSGKQSDLKDHVSSPPFYLSEKIYYERLRGMVIDKGTHFDWGRTAEYYSRSRNIYPVEFWEMLHGAGVGKENQEILDIGTGTGILPMNMKKYGGKYTGVDISAEMIKCAEGIFPEGSFICADAHCMPFENESFDIVTALQCWVYFDKNTLLPELRRVLKRDGQLYVMFMTWLPGEDEIIRKSFEIVKRFNPGWSGFMKRADELDFHKYKDIFTVEDIIKKDLKVPFTRESWCGRMTASRGVGAELTAEKIAEFRSELTEMLYRETEESFTLLHEGVIIKMKGSAGV